MHEGLYERVFAHGAGGLSDEELLRVLLRSGSRSAPVRATAQALLSLYPQLAHLDAADGAALTVVAGIGMSKAVGLIAAIELGARVAAQDRVRFGEVRTLDGLARQMMHQLGGLKQERLLAIYLDARLAVIEQVTVAIGGVSEAVADPRVVFTQALRLNASFVILVHNHPSGHPDPSAADVDMTARFIEAGQIVGVTVLDHLIIGGEGYHSFAQTDERLNFFK